ncbi:alpha/beta hydrolase [bacterium]|nr:alpha/beta hydrolase [bacterium]
MRAQDGGADAAAATGACETSAFDVEGCRVTLRLAPPAGRPAQPSAAPALPVIYLHVFEGDGGDVWRELLGLGCAGFALAAIAPARFDDDMTPWPGPAAFRGAEDFAGGAPQQLDLLERAIMPRVRRELATASPRLWSAIAGYSLAGLFAAWAAYASDAFAGVASVSGSLWYPGFAAFAQTHAPRDAVRAAYLSLGDREGRTRNELMRAVDQDTRAVVRALSAHGVTTTFEATSGGHFTDPARRCARGIRWLLDQAAADGASRSLDGDAPGLTSRTPDQGGSGGAALQ